MKVLIVASKYLPEYSGAGHRIHKTYQRLKNKEKDIEYEVLCSSIEFEKSEQYVYEGVTIERIGKIKGLWRFGSYGEAALTWRALKRKTFDIIHVVGISNVTAAAIYYARINHIPLIIELVTHDASPNQSLPGVHYFWRPDFKAQTGLLSISEHLTEKCNHLGYNDIVWGRPNPVDEQLFSPPKNKSDLRQKLTPFSEKDIVLLMIAKFIPQKNQIFLLDVLKELPDSYKLVLAGPTVSSGSLKNRDIQYIEAIQSKIQALGLENRVFLKVGFVDAAAYMQASDIYVMPNIAEGFGTPILEALSCGLPVVANKAESSFRQFSDIEIVHLCDLDKNQWKEAVLSQRFDRDIALNCAEKIRSLYSTEKVDSTFYKLLKHIASLGKEEKPNLKEALR